MEDGSALVLWAGELKTRSNDTEFRFRPDSDFFYLTGLAEPGAFMVLRPGFDPSFALFVRPRDREAEIWSGRRVGPEGARSSFGAAAAYELDQVHAEMLKLLDGVTTLYFPIGRHQTLDRAIHRALLRLHRQNRTGTAPPTRFSDAGVLMGEQRIVKDDAALASLRRAIDITAAAHVEAMRATRPGMYEFEVEALLEYEFRRRGAGGPGYGTIVGAGANATILHYVDNDAELRDGDLVLIDAGAEWDLHSGDLTRTFPVNGRFSPAQRDLYETVLAANLAGIAAAQVGNDIDAIHSVCLETVIGGLIDLNLLDGTIEQNLESEAYKRYYMHRTSHWLGADVHDAGFYCVDGRARPLQPGFVLTIEPGLYVAADDERAPPEMRGCGIRIEDDVLVRDDGPEILTAAAPKTIAELEDIVGKR
jgi:Xaa-Pro aminopeptidase